MEETLKDFTTNFDIEYTIEKGEMGDREQPNISDYINVTKILYKGLEVINEHLKGDVEFVLNENPELINVELNTY